MLLRWLIEQTILRRLFNGKAASLPISKRYLVHDFGNTPSVSCCDDEDVKDVSVAINAPVAENGDDEDPERAPDDENANAGNMLDVNHNNQMGATYEDNFMEEIRQIAEKRGTRPPARYVEECHVTSNLKPHTDEQVFLDKFSLTSFICSCVREKIDNFSSTRSLV